MKTIILTLLLLLIAVPVMAASVTLSWDAPTTNEDGSPLTDLAGFRTYCGGASGVYDVPVDVGNVLTWQKVYSINMEGQPVFCAVTAYDTSGNESILSNEVSLTFPMIAPSPPTNLQGVVD